MKINNAYSIGQTVYNVTDVDQKPLLIVGIVVRLGHMKYEVADAYGATEVYEFEISDTKNLNLLMNLDSSDSE